MPRAAKAAAASGLSSAFGALPFAICAITDPCRVLRLSYNTSYTLKRLAQRIAPAAAFVHASALQAASSRNCRTVEHVHDESAVPELPAVAVSREPDASINSDLAGNDAVCSTCPSRPSP